VNVRKNSAGYKKFSGLDAPSPSYQTSTVHHKNIKQILIGICVALACSSCQTFYTVGSNGLADIHKNGFKFPQEIDNSKRVYATAFDRSGYDVGPGYNAISKQEPSALTIYVMSVMSGGSLTQDEVRAYFSAASSEIRTAHAGASLVSTSLIRGHGDTGMLREFRYEENFAGRRQALCSLLAVFRDLSCLV
jgi:hypothetical protein